MKPLLIRADASTTIGTGHVMRCLALAQAWQDGGGSVTFVMAETTPAIEERLRTEGVEIQTLEAQAGTEAEAQKAASMARERGAVWVAVDGYQFGAEYQRVLKDAGLKVLFVDDNGHAEHYCANLVLNQNLHACENLYRNREAETRLLLGPRYAMLRREFNKWREWTREIPETARKVLVTMGGSDPENVTGTVIESLARVAAPGLEVKVVVGGSNPNRTVVERTAANSGHLVRCLVDVGNMPDLMAWADVAVAAAGTTMWEMCLLGLPAVVVDLAENQSTLAATLGRLGIARHIGRGRDAISEHLVPALAEIIELSPLRGQMCGKARATVDGYGYARVTALLEGNIRLRRAEPGDCRQLWDWANDSVVRAVSFSSVAIPWEQHAKWFAAQLADPNAVFYIAVSGNGLPIGQVRYRLEGQRATVSISLASESRAQGQGFKVLALATSELWNTTATTVIDAYVKPDNEGSVRLFQRSGFRQVSSEVVQGQRAIRFELERHRLVN